MTRPAGEGTSHEDAGGAMSLTGPLFLGGIIVVTVAAFVLVVIAWPRLTGSSPLQVGGRVGALLVVNLLVLLTAATQLNAAYLFFSGWDDLRGALTGHLAQTSLDRGGSPTTAASTVVDGQAATTASVIPPLTVPVDAHGLATFTVHGPLSGLTGTVLVQLPPGYQSATGAVRRYPVLEAFHGYPSAPAGWDRLFHIGEAMRTQEDAGRLHPTIVVMPQIEIPRGVDTEGVNGLAGQPQLETWLTRDVPDWVAHTFRVEADRDAWATIGYSTGGFDAAMATLLHPAQYGAGIVLGGYYTPEFGRFYTPYPPSSPLAARYDLPAVVGQEAPPVALWLETSHADPVSYPSSTAFLHAVRPPTAVHAVVLKDAGHRISVWVHLLPEALRWLGTNVAGFRP